jgi:hypothetical protein
MKFKIMEINIYLIIYIIIISIIIICNNNNNYTMIKLWLMISHMLSMIHELNVPHHVLNDYCP